MVGVEELESPDINPTEHFRMNWDSDCTQGLIVQNTA